MNRVMKDIPELVKIVRDQQARCKDLVVLNGGVDFKQDESGLAVSIRGAAYRVQDQVHGQIAQKFGGIPMAYYQAMLGRKDGHILPTNLNYWRNVAAGEGKKHLIRLIDDQIRAVLSDRYRPIGHLDILTTVVRTITGQDGAVGAEKPYARGATCFGWHISPTRLSVALMNPSMQVDLKHPEKGVQHNPAGGYDPDAPGHGWVRAKGSKDDGAHWVFPAAFINNSETGHGGLNVEVGLYEALCDNSARIGTNLAQRHLGRQLGETDVDQYVSVETYKTENVLIFSKVSDVIRNAFDPELLSQNVLKMAGLAKVEVDVKEAVNAIVELPGMTDGLRDDIFAAYKPLGQRDTLLDVQRAVTAAAHAVREAEPEKAIALEELGGRIIEKGKAALALA